MTTSQIIQVLFSHLKRIGVCGGGGGGVAVGEDILKEWLKKKKFLKYHPTYCSYQYITP